MVLKLLSSIHGHPAPAGSPGSAQFDGPVNDSLIGLWDFEKAAPNRDTGLGDGRAQNGTFEGNAFAAGGRLVTDGWEDFFDVDGDDAPFRIGQGTLAVSFRQDAQVGTSPDTIVNRGEFADRATEGWFGISVTRDGAVTVQHFANGKALELSTANGFYQPGDTVEVVYSWDAASGGSFGVANVTRGTEHVEDFDTKGLTLAIGDDDDERFTFAARESDDGSYDRFFDGQINYVALYDSAAPLGPADTLNGIVEGTAGNDLIDIDYTGDPDGDRIDAGDAILPGQGPDDDIVLAGAGNDTVKAGLGNDTVFGEAGNDAIFGGPGDDFIDGGTGNDRLFGEAGNDTIFGGDGNDQIDGGDGDDRLFGGRGNDVIRGGAGNDFIDVGDGNDVAFGEDDRDIFTGFRNTDNNVVFGGDGGDDYDTLDLTGSAGDGTLKVIIQGPDSDGNGFDGKVEYFDADGKKTGQIVFKNIEKIIPCFTPGTRIGTPSGEKPVEDLRPGDRVITRDHGVQTVRWVGARTLSRTELALAPDLRAVRIRAGALGHGLPERDMLVSPNHRMLVMSERTRLFFDEAEVLVAAKHLADGDGIAQVETAGVTYIHVMFDHHEVILADGAWSESFQPGDWSLRGLEREQRAELLDLFPELAETASRAGYRAARRSLKKHEARLLMGG
ncbi:MAG: hypothetical protein CVT80_03130 [Alphaproteobacteria bacterium HGW-Alphaproteobacteria-2]|nr:MAG: hypothetical protein CVT80_03130 [Alphaproteobacteria bacterium HGW-Alphaproteobacteria-2]